MVFWQHNRCWNNASQSLLITRHEPWISRLIMHRLWLSLKYSKEIRSERVPRPEKAVRQVCPLPIVVENLPVPYPERWLYSIG